MINLIANELTKIFKKKSIYITLIIALVFIIACNLIYKLQKNSSSYDITSEIEFYEEQLSKLNPNNQEDLEIYLIYKTELDVNKLIQNYGGNETWQAQIIQNNLQPIIEEMNHYQYENKNEVEYEAQKQKYDEIKAKLDTNDWRYFANEEKRQIEEKLNEQNELKKVSQSQIELKEIENQIYNLEVEKQIVNWRLEKDITYGYDYQNTCLMRYRSSKTGIREYENSNNQDNYEEKLQYYDNLETAAVSQYDIERNVTTGNTSDARGILLDIFNQFEIFIIIMSIMIAGSIVSEEFSKGTIKLLLIKPYKRVTILASKFISCLLILMIVIIMMIAMQFIAGGIIQGFDSFKTPAVVYDHNSNQLQEIGIASYLGMQALGKLPIYILLMTLAFAISTIFTNSALSITIGLLGYMGSPFINELGLVLKLNWLKFFVTPNWDLTQYLFGNLPRFQGLTPIFSISIIMVYMLIMLIPTFILFKKKNIKNI